MLHVVAVAEPAALLAVVPPSRETVAWERATFRTAARSAGSGAGTPPTIHLAARLAEVDGAWLTDADLTFFPTPVFAGEETRAVLLTASVPRRAPCRNARGGGSPTRRRLSPGNVLETTAPTEPQQRCGLPRG